MERLTWFDEPNVGKRSVNCRKCPEAGNCTDVVDCKNTVVNRLATIEDILGDDYDLDRLRELIEADREGRCVVLPCQIGTPVYMIRWHIGCAAMDDESYRFVDEWPKPFSLDMLKEFGKTVFLTYEAAEAALKGGG